MKTKLFSLLLLLLCLGSSGAWAAVTDLAFTATKTITAGGEIWWTTATNVASANTAGWCSNTDTYGSNNKYGNITPSLSGDATDTSPANHKIDGVQVKGGNAPAMAADSKGKGKKALAFRVTNTTAITAYGATTSGTEAAGLQWSIYRKTGETTWTAVATNAKGKAAATNNTCTISISGLSASETYIVSIEGGYKGTAGSDVGSNTQDVVVYAVKFAAPQAGKPTINTQPTSANYEVGDEATALTVAATASSGDLSYQWYSNSSATTEGASTLTGQTNSSYKPSTASASTTYYYCAVTDGNGTTNSNFATISVNNVFTPEISFVDPAVTITYTGSGTVYYTTDGSVPSSSNGTEYEEAFNLTNSCTVRAVAKKGENYSDLVKYNCYVDQSSADGFLISTGNHSGSNSGSVWTSNDGNFTLSKPEGDFNWSNNIFPGMHGHKMDNSIVYTLQPSADIMITSIKIVGRTWLNGTAATVAVSGATPSSETWLAGETGNVSYILTKEFAVTANYGEAVTITPTGNQFGCFLEVYGVKRIGPADPQAVAGTKVTWDFSGSSAQTAAGSITASSSNTLKATDGTSIITYVAGSSDGYDSSNGYLKPNGKSGGTSPSFTDRYFCLNITKSGKLSFVGGNTASKSGNYIILQGSSSTIGSATQKGTVANTADDCSFSVDIANGGYVFVAFSAQIYTKSISWTPVTDDITLTTSTNMAGWRAFYDGSNGYTYDANTTAYIVKAKNASTVSLTKIDDIPAATPVILHTTSSADSYKMTLTKAATTSGDATGNLLEVTTAAQDLSAGVYRLGYNITDGVAFYPWSTASATAGIVYIGTSVEARALSFVFDDDDITTSINTVQGSGVMVNGYYDLQGRRVTQPKKGLYIVNGRKVVIK